ncbi:MAG: hypothetical protein ACK5FT_01755 [Sphingomonadales bacterium]
MKFRLLTWVFLLMVAFSACKAIQQKQPKKARAKSGCNCGF